MRKRIASILFWAWVYYTPVGLGAALVAGVCMGVASNHATTFMEETTGHVIPFVVGKRGSPRTVYVTETFSRVSDISRCMFGGWLIGPVALIIGGAFLPKAPKRPN